MPGDKAETSILPRVIIGGLLVLAAGWAYQRYDRSIQYSFAKAAAQTQSLADQTQTLTEQAAATTQSTEQTLTALQTTLQALASKLENLNAQQKAAETASNEALKPIQSQLQRLDTQINDLSVRLAQQEKHPALPSNPSPDTPTTIKASDELVLLKERNRLTLQADEALATAKAAPLRALWTSLRDPNLSGLKHAAAAEIIRVQNHLDHLTRIPPDYHISPNEKALTPPELIAHLQDQEKPFQTRARAAILLTGTSTKAAGDALIQAMRTDPELDVVKEAQHALHATFHFKVPLFDTLSAENWWTQNQPKQ